MNELLSYASPDTAILRIGGYTRESADQILGAGKADLIGWGRAFITNPDLPVRLRHGYPLAPFHSTEGHYGGGSALYTTHSTWVEAEAAAWEAKQRESSDGAKGL